jgi:hypothetical protein
MAKPQRDTPPVTCKARPKEGVPENYGPKEMKVLEIMGQMGHRVNN